MKRQPWTSKERSELQAFYPFVSAKNLQRLLPDRTEKAIRQAAWDAGYRKCHERVRERAHENINRRWHPDPGVFKTPESPSQ